MLSSAAGDAAVGAKARDTLYSVQVMRGFAAAAVALYHTHLILKQPEYGGLDLFGAVASRGWTGVNYFFVLSGFIILRAHYQDIGRPDRAPRYLWRRFSRVYPIYWLFLTLYIAAAGLGIGHPDFSWNASNLLASYALLGNPEAVRLPIAVAWTLFYEIQFYLIFCVTLLSRRLGIAVGVLWMAGILYNSVIRDSDAGGWFHMWNIYFALGAGAYFLFRRLDRRWAGPLVGTGVATFIALLLAGGVGERIHDAHVYQLKLAALAVPFTLLVLGGALAERGRQWRAPSFLLLLGNASYAIYLVHAPAISIMAQLNHRFAAGLLPPEFLFLLVFVGSLVAGVLAHLLAERPLLALLRNLARHRGAGAERADNAVPTSV